LKNFLAKVTKRRPPAHSNAGVRRCGPAPVSHTPRIHAVLPKWDAATCYRKVQGSNPCPGANFDFTSAFAKKAAGISTLNPVEREFRVKTSDGVMRVFVARPDSGQPLAVAVVYMDGVGYREQIKENARRFAASGYYCAAPDLYYRAGEGLTFDFSKIASEGYERGRG
jgi:hypothetical protein